ncbi:MAG: hypothetical protein HQM10_04005 [Candidatus Riflebacteria bacterium]|nr:hypothetical protein [Candidatus Riflebacteria bacterium]
MKKYRSGFILMLALFMVVFLFLAGWMLMSFTIQSKNVFSIFYRDDIARLIAESAIAEKRVMFENDLKTNAAYFQKIVNCGNMSSPSSQKLEDFTHSSLPQTTFLISKLGLSGVFTVSGSVTVKDIDRILSETGGVRKKYDREYQASVQIKLNIGNTFKGRSNNTVYAQEYDFKLVSLRSPGNRPAGNGYTTNVTNDYVLFIRDASNEFKQFSGESLNNDKVRLALVQDANSSNKGKIYFGCPDNQQVFINVSEDTKKIIPPDMPLINIPWNDIKTFMPLLAQKLEKIKTDAEKDSKGQVSIDLTKVEAQIAVAHNPITEKPGFWNAVWTKISSLFNKFFDSFKNKDKEKGNKQRGIGIASENDIDQGVCDKIEGKLRQRFWQTATIKFDLSKISNNSDFQNELKKKDADMIKDIPYVPQETLTDIENKRSAGTALNDGEELAMLIYHYQNKENRNLFSCANDRFRFKPSLQKSDQDQDFPEPKVINKMGAADVSTFLPFSSYLLRSYNFSTAEEFFGSSFMAGSPLYDSANNIITLKGIVSIGQPITLKKGLKYRGAGVLIALGDINIEGSVAPVDPLKDGPFFIYTWVGNINANVVEQGKIEASLIALNWQFSTGTRSFVNFNKKKAEVFGNIIADRINLAGMGENVDNSITYDYQRLGRPQDLYTFFFGGQSRITAVAFDHPSL